MKKTTLSGSSPKRNLIVEIIASLLLIFFVHTLISSWIQLQSLKNLFALYTVSYSTVAWSIIVVEFITVLLLFIPQTRVIGFILALTISLFVAYIILRTPSYPHDFGGVFTKLSKAGRWYLLVGLVLLSLTGIVSSLLRNKNVLKDTVDEQHAIFT